MIEFFHILIIPMTLLNDIMPLLMNLCMFMVEIWSILWSPLKIWTPKNFTTANFRHPVSKSWLRHWTALTLMLLLTDFTNTKWCKNPGKWLKPWQMGTHRRVLSECFPMDTNMTGFSWFQGSLHLWVLDESSLSIGRVISRLVSLNHILVYLECTNQFVRLLTINQIA